MNMKKKYFLTKIMLAIFLCTTSTLFAADGYWIDTDYYTEAHPVVRQWSDPSMWSDGTVAGGSGYTAYLTNGIDFSDAAKGIQLSGESISHIVVAFDNNDPSSYYVLVGDTLTLLGTPTIEVSEQSNCAGLVIGYPGFGGSIDGTEGFTKNGPGRLFFEQPCPNLSGTINVNSGVLLITDPDGIQNADVVVNATGILGLDGRDEINNIKTVTVNNGGNMQWTSSNIGTLYSGNILFQAGGTYNWRVNSTVADLIDISGTFTIPAGGMTINVLSSGSPDYNTYTIAKTSDGVVGDANNITMSYDAGADGPVHPIINGDDIEITFIPEPLTFGIIATISLVFFSRNKFSSR